MKTAIVMDNGFEELEAMGPIDMLIRGGLDLDIVSIPGTSVTGRSGVTITDVIPMKWLPPMASESPSPVVTQTLSRGLATLTPVATAFARPCTEWNP